jgi:hypothetical protein
VDAKQCLATKEHHQDEGVYSEETRTIQKIHIGRIHTLPKIPRQCHQSHPNESDLPDFGTGYSPALRKTAAQRCAAQPAPRRPKQPGSRTPPTGGADSSLQENRNTQPGCVRSGRLVARSPAVLLPARPVKREAAGPCGGAVFLVPPGALHLCHHACSLFPSAPANRRFARGHARSARPRTTQRMRRARALGANRRGRPQAVAGCGGWGPGKASALRAGAAVQVARTPAGAGRRRWRAQPCEAARSAAPSPFPPSHPDWPPPGFRVAPRPSISPLRSKVGVALEVCRLTGECLAQNNLHHAKHGPLGLKKGAKMRRRKEYIRFRKGGREANARERRGAGVGREPPRGAARRGSAVHGSMDATGQGGCGRDDAGCSQAPGWGRRWGRRPAWRDRFQGVEGMGKGKGRGGGAHHNVGPPDERVADGPARERTDIGQFHEGHKGTFTRGCHTTPSATIHARGQGERPIAPRRAAHGLRSATLTQTRRLRGGSIWF